MGIAVKTSCDRGMGNSPRSARFPALGYFRRGSFLEYSSFSIKQGSGQNTKTLARIHIFIRCERSWVRVIHIEWRLFPRFSLRGSDLCEAEVLIRMYFHFRLRQAPSR